MSAKPAASLFVAVPVVYNLTAPHDVKYIVRDGIVHHNGNKADTHSQEKDQSMGLVYPLPGYRSQS